MTPADEAEFIRLWQEGAGYEAIAQALGCPIGTVASRSAALAARSSPSGSTSIFTCSSWCSPSWQPAWPLL
jgi:hypothetical protein